MLPSMPILFTRESQDAFGNKIQCSTNVYIQNNAPSVSPQMPTSVQPQKESKSKSTVKCKQQVKSNLPASTNEDPKEMALVTSYFSKVRTRFVANIGQPTNKFVQFQEVLKTFNPQKETPIDLYRKIEKLFGEDHKDLTEDFLLFLSPSQAEQIGRFMDHLEMNKLNNFIELLQSTFAHHPTILRKIIRAVTNSLNCGNVNEMKSRVLPHFRSHPRLAQMFKLLFPDERPPESFYETTDIINESILTDDQGYDVWEFEEPKKVKATSNVKGGSDTVYVQGRVFLRHGRMVRAARVTFPYSKEPYRVHARRLAPAHCPLTPSPPDSDEERATQPRNITNKNTKSVTKRPKKLQTKSCARNVMKDVNDNNKQILESIRLANITDNTRKCSRSSATTDKQASKHITQDSKLDAKEAKHTRQSSKDKAESIKHTDRNHTHKRDKQKDKQDNKHKNVGDQKKDEGTKAKQPKLVIEVKNLGHRQSQSKIETSSWTRDEDKTMLQILKGEAGSERIFGKIRELLPHRSLTDIRGRFLHVMTLLQQMAVGEVT